MNAVTVDIDINFEEWIGSSDYQIIKQRIRDKVRDVKRADIRRSSNNHVHVKVTLYRELSLFQSLCLRAFLDDDPARLACDLERFYRTGKIEETGRCFDEKYSRGKLKKAGEWVKIV